MNQRIQALLLRLSEDEKLRTRFVKNGREVMDEAGLEPAERAEVIRHVDADGHPNAASIIPTEEMAALPKDAPRRALDNGSRPRY